MALTETERAEIRMYLGWSARFHQFDNELEGAMNALDDPAKADTLALFQNPLAGSPPGFLAVLRDIDAKILAAHGRLKADVVGSIKLNRREAKQLYKEGKRITSRMARTLGVEVIHNVWDGTLPTVRSSRLGNYQVHG